MTITVYTDGGAGNDPKYGFFVKESCKSHVEKYDPTPYEEGLLNMVSEYLALKSALLWLKTQNAKQEEIIIYSDSQVMVNQVNHEASFNNETLRDLAREIWPMMNVFDTITLKWISRKVNPAGKMLGS